jgi:hypothetical protein
MWMFTKHGFYSVVRNTKPGESGLLVRGREVGHLNALCDRLDWSRDRVLETPANDYRFRVLVTDDEWARAAAVLASEIDYGNFKGVCGERAYDGALDSAYVKTLGKVWKTMHDYQQANA